MNSGLGSYHWFKNRDKKKTYFVQQKNSLTIKERKKNECRNE